MSEREEKPQEKPDPYAKVRSLYEEDDKRVQLWQTRRERRLKLHTVAGMLIFFILNVFFGAPSVFEPLNMFITFLMSAIFGLPLGFVISWVGGGMPKGAIVSSIAFTMVWALLILIGVADAEHVLLESLVAGALFGAIPGALIGWHVNLDE